MTTPNGVPGEDANTAPVERWARERRSNGYGEIAMAADDRVHGALVQLGDGGCVTARLEYFTAKTVRPGGGRRLHPS